MRDFGHEGTESVNKCSIYIIGDEHQIGIILFNDVNDLFPFLWAQSHRWRIAWINQVGYPDLRIFQFIKFLVRILPVVHTFLVQPFGLDKDHLEVEPVKFRNFDVRGKRWNKNRNLVSPFDQKILHERIENIAHCSGSAFCCKNVVPAFWRFVAAHFLD